MEKNTKPPGIPDKHKPAATRPVKVPNTPDETPATRPEEKTAHKAPAAAAAK